jgi:hypothetical protein
VADLAPSQSTFTDPIRAETPEEDAPNAPPPAPPATPQPVVPPDAPDEGGADAAAYDARGEIERLRSELTLSHQRQALFERELQLRAYAAEQQQQATAGATQQRVDPILQEVIDILQVSEDDLVEVFSGGPKAAQVVTQALQTTALLAINAAEKRLVQYYQRDQQTRQQATVVEQRSQQMHDAFWSNYPELQEHEVIVQYYAAQVAAEHAQAPRFDWNSAQQEVARRTVAHLQQQYNVQVAPAAPTTGARRPAPPLQSRLRPAFGEMGGGSSTRAITPSSQQQLTNEILDLGRGH